MDFNKLFIKFLFDLVKEIIVFLIKSWLSTKNKNKQLLLNISPKKPHIATYRAFLYGLNRL